MLALSFIKKFPVTYLFIGKMFSSAHIDSFITNSISAMNIFWKGKMPISWNIGNHIAVFNSQRYHDNELWRTLCFCNLQTNIIACIPAQWLCTYICQAKENSHVCLGFVLIVLVDPFGLRQLNGKTCESINHFLPHWVGRLFWDDWWLRGHLCHRLWVVYSINFTGPDYYLQNFVFCPFGRSSLVTLPTHMTSTPSLWPPTPPCDPIKLLVPTTFLSWFRESMQFSSYKRNHQNLV